MRYKTIYKVRTTNRKIRMLSPNVKTYLNHNFWALISLLRALCLIIYSSKILFNFVPLCLSLSLCVLCGSIPIASVPLSLCHFFNIPIYSLILTAVP